MGSSSHDLLMAAALALTKFTCAIGCDASAMVPYTGQISVTEEYKALKEWANNYRDQTTRESSLAKAQMQHLIGVLSESKQGNDEYYRATTYLNAELVQVKASAQSEVSTAQTKLKQLWQGCESRSAIKEEVYQPNLATYQSEAQSAHNTNAQILQEYATSCKSLELA